MPSIGSFSFPVDDGLDSGIALLLAKPPDKELSLTYGGNQILAGPGTPYVICRFAGAHCLGSVHIYRYEITAQTIRTNAM